MDDFSQTEHLLAQDDVVAGAVDYKGRPALRSKSGRWKSVILIIGTISESVLSSPILSFPPLSSVNGFSHLLTAATLLNWCGRSGGG